MSGDYLLDTNIVIGLLNNEKNILRKINSITRVIQIPSIVIGELYYGAELSQKRIES